MAHCNLGIVLWDKKDQAGAEAAYREAIRLDPKYANAHYNLGNVLRDKKDQAGAEAAYREAIRLDPKFAWAHCNLGWTLQQEGDLDGAVAEYKEALRIDPKQSNALSNLPKAERMRQVSSRLPDVLAGKAEPETPTEACAFAELCGQPFQKRYAAAARLFEALSRPTRSWPPTSRLVIATMPPATPSWPPAARGSTLRPPQPEPPCGRRPSAGSAPTWPSGRSRPPSAARPPS